jgi:hypothetical protein
MVSDCEELLDWMSDKIRKVERCGVKIMYRALIWGSGDIFCRNFNLLKSYEMCKNIKISAITSNMTVFDSFAEIKYVAKKDIIKDDYDIVIVMSEDYLDEIVSEAHEIGFAPEQVISYKALIIPNLNLEKYMELKKDVPTIFARNCWGHTCIISLALNLHHHSLICLSKKMNF